MYNTVKRMLKELPGQTGFYYKSLDGGEIATLNACIKKLSGYILELVEVLCFLTGRQDDRVCADAMRIQAFLQAWKMGRSDIFIRDDCDAGPAQKRLQVFACVRDQTAADQDFIRTIPEIDMYFAGGLHHHFCCSL